ncbi:MAG: hypothetical protein KJ558_03230 [Gammaproteobacteria bacterium]|nr:hypothetical protein [Gammaproteobacteria bacterium]MBU1653838.1 hypothetical protein [Gammaproteobacteria bacterium]MBU1961641.1 hypothetical protein [Gammaproteobacteria bacterium]
MNHTENAHHPRRRISAPRLAAPLLLPLALFLSACTMATADLVQPAPVSEKAGHPARGPQYPASYAMREVRPWDVLKETQIDTDLEKQILALNPDRVSEGDIRATLARAPAPRIINVHGGYYPVYLKTIDFAQFLIGMGYPEAKVRLPSDGSYSYSPYGNSTKLTGYFAWYYEREGMRPMMLGYSLGGFHTIKVLYTLAGELGSEPEICNPLTGRSEKRKHILDPLTGQQRRMDSLRIPYAHAVASGGAARFVPNQWIIGNRLRTIPDSVDEFTGYFMEGDFLGGDLLGYANNPNYYEAAGQTRVRNFKLPAGYTHLDVVLTKHLSKSRKLRDWINAYVPSKEPVSLPDFGERADNILFAADVWFHVKRHWVLELQRMIKARSAMMQRVAQATR